MRQLRRCPLRSLSRPSPASQRWTRTRCVHSNESPTRYVKAIDINTGVALQKEVLLVAKSPSWRVFSRAVALSL